jgi:hypothetical protein
VIRIFQRCQYLAAEHVKMNETTVVILLMDVLCLNLERKETVWRFNTEMVIPAVEYCWPIIQISDTMEAWI